jgi:hypothetical protein
LIGKRNYLVDAKDQSKERKEVQIRVEKRTKTKKGENVEKGMQASPSSVNGSKAKEKAEEEEGSAALFVCVRRQTTITGRASERSFLRSQYF